jgi:hypothetical protein
MTEKNERDVSRLAKPVDVPPTGSTALENETVPLIVPEREENHVHDCTGLDRRCPCGFVFRVPPVCVSLHVYNGPETIVSDGFNCEDYSAVIGWLRQVIRKLERAQPVAMRSERI